MYKIMGIPYPYFIGITIIYIAAIYLGKLPTGLIGALGLMIIFGAIFDEIGNRTPILKDYLGGGAILAIFMGGAFVYFKLLPEAVVKDVRTFMVGGTFLDFYVSALLCGSILGMSKGFLIQSFVRYLPLILGGVLTALLFVALGGFVSGYGAKEAILYIGLPIMGGGVGAGAIPLASVYAQEMGIARENIISIMLPAISLGNAFSIVAAGLMDKLGSSIKGLSGEGRLMKIQEISAEEENTSPVKVTDYGVGLIFACSFFTFGVILGKYIPIHPYALTIISIALAKVFGLIPQQYEMAAFRWYQLIAGNFTPALLLGIGVVYLDIGAVIDSFSIQYMILVFLTILGASLGAGFCGYIFGFYPIEAAITGGLCMSNMGGTGDVAVLQAAKRLPLMPFAQISSRLGGAFIILLATFIVKILHN